MYIAVSTQPNTQEMFEGQVTSEKCADSFLPRSSSSPFFKRVAQTYESFLGNEDNKDSMNDDMKLFKVISSKVIGQETIKSMKGRCFVVAPVYRGIEPLLPRPANSGPQASQQSGWQSSHCTIESGIKILQTRQCHFITHN